MKFKALYLFAGIGGGALGFQWAREEWKGTVGTIDTLAGIDNDEEACQDFRWITGSHAETMDLFSYHQKLAFHGKEPSRKWHEVMPEDIWKATEGEVPDVIFLSPPCKGYSGLLGANRAATAKYQALNELTIRGIHLCLEAYKEDLPAMFLLENVPRITKRGKPLLAQIKKLLKRYGYATAEGYHDCGEIGGLGQHRRRYLLIARNERKVPAFVYHPPVKPMKVAGDVLESLPMPNDPAGGKMHRLPRLQWKTWLRLALIRPGKDWRDLERDFSQYCLVTDGKETDIPPVATGFKSGTHGTIYKVSRWDVPAATITGAYRPNNGAICINDPRLNKKPRSGTFGVLDWDQAANTITGSADVHAGTAAIADPRMPEMNEKGIWVILGEDGTWHRPLTTLELAALQGFPTRIYGKPLELAGNNEARWRERIGNAVPPPAARAIAETMLRTLMAAQNKEWLMSAEEIWVQPETERDSIRTIPIH